MQLTDEMQVRMGTNCRVIKAGEEGAQKQVTNIGVRQAMPVLMLSIRMKQQNICSQRVEYLMQRHYTHAHHDAHITPLGALHA